MTLTIPVRALVMVLCAGLLLLTVWVVVDWLVVTDAERIDGVLNKAAKAAEKREVDFLVDNCLHPSFKLGTLDRETTRARGKEALEFFELTQVKKYSSDVKVTGDTAHAKVRTFVSGGKRPTEMRVDWELNLQREGERSWGITGARAFWLIGFNRQELPLEDLLRHPALP
jgi:hypothetical protein